MTIGSVEARNIDKINLRVNQGDLPIRLLLPATEGDLDFGSFIGGSTALMAWVIKDLCLFAPVSAGSGVEQYAESMVDYIALYIDEVKANRCAGEYGTVLAVSIKMSPVKWAEKIYWAVDTTLTIKEII